MSRTASTPPTTKRTPPSAPRGDVTATTVPYSDDEDEFIRAMREYQRQTGRKFPTWSEALQVLLKLGYRKATTPEGGVS